MRDVAHVRDGYPPQTNIARVDGKRAIVMNVLKTGNASTLDIISGINQKLPFARAALPKDLKLVALSDQSIFVRAAISGVIREGVIAASLTGLLILLFLGSWRSTLIITISIPLSVLTSVACLAAFGETINIMTLGGLALSVGILVDDATVTIENINYHLEQGSEVEQAILEGAHQIALPALVSTLSICIVFVPMFQLAGIAKYLFIPLAEAVVFAMIASYILSRTLIPTLAKFWLKKKEEDSRRRKTGLARFQERFEHGFERMRSGYRELLTLAIDGGSAFAGIFLLAIAAAALLAFPIGPLPGLGQDFFPNVDAGQLKLHLRAPTGTRIEETAILCDQVEKTLRDTIKPGEITSIVDNLGLPYSGINLAYSTSAPVGPGDADIFINFTKKHSSLYDYQRDLRVKLAASYPSTQFEFLPADIVSQILNFGLPSPLDVQVTGSNLGCESRIHREAAAEIRRHPGRGRPAHPAALRLPANQCRRGSQQGDIPRSHPAERRIEHADLALGQLPDLTLVLDRSEERYAIQRGRTNTSVPHELAQRSRQYPARPHRGIGPGRIRHVAGSRQRIHHASQCRAGGGEPLQRSSRIRHLRQRPRRGPRLGGQRSSTRSSTRQGRTCRRVPPFTSKARSKPCGSPSTACCSAWWARSSWCTC